MVDPDAAPAMPIAKMREIAMRFIVRDSTFPVGDYSEALSPSTQPVLSERSVLRLGLS